MAAITTILYQSPLFEVGEFRCPAGDPRWSEVNSIGDGDHLVFPGPAVGIRHERGRMTVADPTLVVYYRAGEHYRRQLRDARGDESVFVIPSAPALSGIDGAELAFHARFGPAGRAAYASQAVLVAALRRRPQLDPLLVEELLLSVVADSLARAGREIRAPRTPCDDAVEQARASLATGYAERRSLAAIASDVGVSPFHLARRFRLRTGRSLHQYRDQVRLRQALLRLRDPVDLGRLALDLGYCSHSHFTDAFRRSFGLPPSAVRGGSAGALRQLAERLPAPDSEMPEPRQSGGGDTPCP
ncbi:MAG TPA: AraC family transcriptional regulator [Gaiellales bacterium]|nr:AraC family transcriptional regulator [Gaiellales bacterium]